MLLNFHHSQRSTANSDKQTSTKKSTKKQKLNSSVENLYRSGIVNDSIQWPATWNGTTCVIPHPWSKLSTTVSLHFINTLVLMPIHMQVMLFQLYVVFIRLSSAGFIPTGLHRHGQHVSWTVADKNNLGGCHSRRVLPVIIRSTGQTGNARILGSQMERLDLHNHCSRTSTETRKIQE